MCCSEMLSEVYVGTGKRALGMRRALQCKAGSLFICWHTRAAQKSEDGLCKTAAIAGSIFKVKALNHLWLRPISQPFIYKGKEISSTSVNTSYQSSTNAVPLQTFGRHG